MRAIALQGAAPRASGRETETGQTMAKRTCLAIILAAGEGTRMRSALPKVMHKVGGLPMLGHVIAATRAAGATRLAVVVGTGADQVRDFVASHAPDAGVYVQTERLGTAHAVLAARKELARGYDDVIVVFGDTPLVAADTLRKMRRGLARGSDVVVLGFRPADPLRYGRLIMDGKRLVAIREQRTERRGTGNRFLQCRRHGVLGRDGGTAHQEDRQRQFQGRILPHRPRGARQ